MISVVRNEQRRLPGWLDHYRTLGLRRFVLVDNGSEDGTFTYLKAQADVTVIRTRARFSEANFGMDWVNQIRRIVPAGTWTLFADADEYVVFDGWPVRGVDNYLSQVGDAGATAAMGFMLDMYPSGKIEDVEASSDLSSACPYFDRDYLFRARPHKPWEASQPSLEIVGGPRVRMLSSLEREARSTWVDYFLRGQLDRLIDLTPKPLLKQLVSHFPRTMPALKKTPFLRGHNVAYINNHDVENARFFWQNCVSLHYKFTSDFTDSARTEAVMSEHYRRGAEYMMYQSARSQKGTILYQSQISERLSSSADLVMAGLIRDLRDVLPKAIFA